jgi:histidinol-phosphate/aromatic aminotransferase/cobyric acid decarboxylase-like protein
VTTVAPGPHGGDGARVAARLGLDPASVIDLSASLNPFAPDAAAAAAELLRCAPTALSAYPDPNEATAALAAAIGVDERRLVLTNGGAEAIALVAAVMPEGMVVDPEFSLYRRHLAVVRDDAPRWRSNPSNPLGRLAGADETAAVWDEAFYPLATGRWTRGDDTAWRLGSLTKLWSCPGLRLGFVIAPDAPAADAVRARQPRWAVNGLAAALVPVLLAATDLAGWQRELAAARSRFAGELAALGFTVAETEVNWVLVEADSLRDRLLPAGVVVRDATSFGLPGTYRVALPRNDQLERVLAAFAAVAAAR